MNRNIDSSHPEPARDLSEIIDDIVPDTRRPLTQAELRRSAAHHRRVGSGNHKTKDKAPRLTLREQMGFRRLATVVALSLATGAAAGVVANNSVRGNAERSPEAGCEYPTKLNDTLNGIVGDFREKGADISSEDIIVTNANGAVMDPDSDDPDAFVMGERAVFLGGTETIKTGVNPAVCRQLGGTVLRTPQGQ